jgi:hypothetical protein
MLTYPHGRMARGDHGIPKVSPGPALPYPFTPCGRATPETAVRQCALTKDVASSNIGFCRCHRRITGYLRDEEIRLTVGDALNLCTGERQELSVSDTKD